MDTKILIIALFGLVGFFVYQKCAEDDSNYDAKRKSEQTVNVEAQQKKQAVEAETRKIEAQTKAANAQGKRAPEKHAVFETNDFRAELSSRGGTLTSLTLKHPQYIEPRRNWETGRRDTESDKEVPVNLVTTNTKDYEWFNPLQFEVNKGLDSLIPNPDYEIVEQSPRKIVFRYTQPGLPVMIVKKFELSSQSRPYQIWLTVRVTNSSREKVVFSAGISQHGYQHQSEASGSMFSKQPNLLQGICRHGEDLFAKAWNDSALETPFSGVGRIGFVGVQDNYFLSAMIPNGEGPFSCHISAAVHSTKDKDDQWGRVIAELRFAETHLMPGASEIYQIKNYLGPKQYRRLQSIGHHLETSVDFGWLWPICQVLLSILFFFQSFVTNWGVSIILLTVLVKVVLMPLTHKSFQSAERMKALKPEVDKINEKFKDDPQAKQRETMAMYKQNKVNPLGGCIPSLLQMPIWFALFRTLRASPELYHAPFFGWIDDLSNPDPYFVTPIVMGAMMFVQQRFTPMTGDSAQAKMMMYFMPIMFTAMMLFLPSGLTLYIMVNTMLSIGHQMVIHRRSRLKAEGRIDERGSDSRRSEKGKE